MFRALKKSNESEKRLLKRCSDLNDTIVNNATRVKAAIRLTQEDQAAINLLKREVDRAWKLVENAKDKEDKNRKEIEMLKGQVAHQNDLLQGGAGITTPVHVQLEEVKAERDDMLVRMREQAEDLRDLNLEKTELIQKLNKKDVQMQQRDSEIKQMRQEVEQSSVKLNMLERQLEDEKNKVDGLKQSDRDNQEMIESFKAKNKSLMKQNDDHLDEIEKLATDKGRIQDECQLLRQHKVGLYDEKFKVEEDLKRTVAEQTRLLNALEGEKKKSKLVERENNLLTSNVRELETYKKKLTLERNEAVTERDNTKRYLTAIEREFSWLKRKTEDEQNNILKLERDRNKLATDFFR